jgi:hypothetical protein
MAYLHREYWKIGEQEIKASISFNRELTNWATSEPKKIGYQATCTPVTRTKSDPNIVIEEFGAFTGFNDCLLEVDRQSAKRLQKAIEELNKRKEQYLNWFKAKYGYTDTPVETE